MKKTIIILGILTACLTITILFINVTPANNAIKNQPVTKPDGSKWQLAYCESESFLTYSQTLVAIVNGLEENGWLNNLEGFEEVAESNDSLAIWNWLASREVSPYIDFTFDAFYNLRDSEQERLIKRLQDKDDIDLMIVMGAAAGNLLSNAKHDTNVLVFAASNAVRSGIITSVEDSGKDNVWAHMDAQRFERQTKAFYDIFKFKKLGIVYEDSDNARVYSAIDELEKLAAEKHFEIIRYHVTEPRSVEEYSQYYSEVQSAYNKLAHQVDAVYITIASLESEKLSELFQPFYEKKVPIFSQLGSSEVKNGALITVSVMDEVNIGRFGADTISKCLHGTKPRDLEQSFQSAPQITLNTDVAKKIGFKLPFELLIVVDKTYQTINP